jgi:hypothetical protein
MAALEFVELSERVQIPLATQNFYLRKNPVISI